MVPVQDDRSEGELTVEAQDREPAREFHAAAVGGAPGQPGKSTYNSNISLSDALCDLLGVGKGGAIGEAVPQAHAAVAAAGPQVVGSVPASSGSEAQLRDLLGSLWNFTVAVLQWGRDNPLMGHRQRAWLRGVSWGRGVRGIHSPSSVTGRTLRGCVRYRDGRENRGAPEAAARADVVRIANAAICEVYLCFEVPLGAHLKQEVRDRICKGKYVEIFSLLPLEKFNLDRVKSDDSKEDEEKRQYRLIPRTFVNWLQAFTIMARVIR